MCSILLEAFAIQSPFNNLFQKWKWFKTFFLFFVFSNYPVLSYLRPYYLTLHDLFVGIV